MFGSARLTCGKDWLACGVECPGDLRREQFFIAVSNDLTRSSAHHFNAGPIHEQIFAADIFDEYHFTYAVGDGAEQLGLFRHPRTWWPHTERCDQQRRTGNDN